MYLLLLMLAQAASPSPTATPAPAVTPTRTPVVTNAIAPKTLQDLARERRGKPKPPGSLTTYEGSAGSGEQTEIASVGRPALRILEVQPSGEHKAAGGFVGVVKNVGTLDACAIRLRVEALDRKGTSLGVLEVSAGAAVLHPGETAPFEGVVNTGKSVSKEEAELGGGAVESDVRAKGGGVVGSFRATVKSVSECK
jgi:phosphotransferase system IIB component